MAFNMFRKIQELRCYYEPFHPKLIKHAFWNGRTEIERDEKQVYHEYKLLEKELNKYFYPIGAPVLPVKQEIDEKYWTQGHSQYLSYLFNTSKNVLIQPVRVNYHLQSMHANFPRAKFIWILRSPEGVVSSLMQKTSNLFQIRDTPFLFSNILNNALKIYKFIGKSIFKNRYLHLQQKSGFWSHDLIANYIINHNPKYRKFKNYPIWFKLMISYYDSVEAVEKARQIIPSENFALIRYEDICHDPNYIMAEICKWIKLDCSKYNFREDAFLKPSSVVRPDDKRWIWANNELNDLIRQNNPLWEFPSETRIG